MIAPRDELRTLSPAVHGGAAPAGVIDFSTGVSPLPAPRSVLEAARTADLSRYPDPTARPLRERLAAREGVDAKQIVVGAGSVELIWALARAFAGPQRRGVVFAPAFGEYAQALEASGAELRELRAEAPPWLADVEAAKRALDGAQLAFLCRPSNPCLSSLPSDRLRAIAESAPSTLLVVDEAYLPMFDALEPSPPLPNVVRLRSLTKVFALPGLRLGYAIAPNEEIARYLQLSLPPWNVSSPAQAAGLACVDALDEVPAIRREIARLRGRFAERLSSPRVRLEAQGGPFLLFDVGDARRAAEALGPTVRVRDCTSFGLPRHLRIGVRAERELDVLVEKWRQI